MKTTTKTNPVAIPQTEKCYACDARETVGVRDFRPEGGAIEAACTRHADPTVRAQHVCCYCNGPLRKGFLFIDFNRAHAKCHRTETTNG